MLSTNYHNGNRFQKPTIKTIGRFVRTFLLSFILTTGVLSVFGLIPGGVRDIPHRLYVSYARMFVSDEAALAAVLPDASPVIDVTKIAVSERAYLQKGDTGIDWPALLPAASRTTVVMLRIPVSQISVPVVSPESTAVADLDRSLETGVVHYPGSGVPGEKSNILLFGHSSHLPVVNNPAYKALNDLEYVRLGDDVYLETDTTTFHYRVSAIRLTTADEELVTFKTDRRMVTISTCNTFGQKSERFVVEAILVGSEQKETNT